MISATFSVSRSGIGITGLKKRLAGLTGLVANVGVLSRTNRRDNSHLATGSTGKDAGNADVGFAAEFGTVTPYHATSAVTGATISGQGVPERSFLRVPLTNHLTDKAAQIGEVVVGVVTSGFAPALAVQALGEAGVEVVHEAFDSGGDGSWPANSPATVRFKSGATPLVDTGQLRDSIATEVVKA